ncbi:carbohydrate-binding protein [Streptomyces sp. AC627_RSS907]|uniref:carbohydrate-binding protein n=1 Tax=Streptomyces sp. AC627_RSS907 TaxID=2823684 RepID=UPI001C254A48|nr:carbohydrate-binding protein [Streptomyces sp. AC627_RSS907]
MTPGNNGASTPEDDDPFGYLYADGQANGAQPPSGGYGYPNSVNRVRPVGTRQYGAPQGQAAPQQQGAYGQPNAHYAAPETFPGGGAPTAPPQPGHGGGGGRRGPNTKGLLIGAVAVVAAVVVGIAVAMSGVGSDDDKGGDEAGASPAPTQSQSTEPSPSASDKAEEKTELPATDAKALRLSPGVTTASDIKGARSEGGVYVSNLNQPGASVTWTVDGIPEDGPYTLFAGYSAAGEDQSMTLTVNGKEFGNKLNLGNFTHAEDGDFAKGWTKTYAWPTLNKGTNTITLSCNDGDKCNVLLDQFSLKKGQVKD